MKTPEELAQEYIDKEWSWKGEWNNQAAYSFRTAFLAGYAAAIQTAEENMKPNKLSRAFESVENPHRIRCHGAWISVEEELPEREGEYLVYSQFGKTECCTKLLLSRLRVAFFSMNDESRIVTTEGFLYPDGCIDFNISHWMPLPPLPNE